MINRILLATVLLNWNSAMATPENKQVDAWVCVTAQTTGFAFVADHWESSNFLTEGESFIIRPTKKSDPLVDSIAATPFGVFRIGSLYPAYLCTTNKNHIICDTGPGDFHFSKETLRFASSYLIGYWDGSQNFTPTISIGKCSPL